MRGGEGVCVQAVIGRVSARGRRGMGEARTRGRLRGRRVGCRLGLWLGCSRRWRFGGGFCG